MILSEHTSPLDFFFLWLHRVFVAAHGLLSSCGVRVFSLCLWYVGSRVRELCSCGVWTPERMGSVVCGTWALSLRHAGLSGPMACGILVPRPGIESASPALEGGFFTTGPPGKSLLQTFELHFPIFLRAS